MMQNINANKLILEKIIAVEREKEDFRNVSKRVGFYLAAGNLVSIIVQLIMVPVLIYYWGGELYGEWIIIFTIPAMLSLMDFGLIAVSNNLIDSLCNEKKYISSNRIYYNSIIFLSFLFTILIFLSIVSWIFFKEYFFDIFLETKKNILGYLFFLMVTDSIISIFLNHNSALYRTIDKFHWTANWQNCGRIFPLLGVALVALNGFFLLEAAIAMVMIRLIILLIMLIDIKTRIYWLNSSWFYISKRILRNILRNAIGFMALPISNLMVLHLTTILIAMSYSATIVALYNSLRTFTRLIPQFVSIVGKSLWSEISKNKNNEKKMYIYVLRRTLVLSFICLCGYLILGKAFFMKWTHSSLGFDNILFVFLILNAIGIALYTSLEVFLLAKNNANKYALIFFLVSFFQVFMGWIFSFKIGLFSYPFFGFLGAVFIVMYLILSIRCTVDNKVG